MVKYYFGTGQKCRVFIGAQFVKVPTRRGFTVVTMVTCTVLFNVLRYHTGCMNIWSTDCIDGLVPHLVCHRSNTCCFWKWMTDQTHVHPVFLPLYCCIFISLLSLSVMRGLLHCYWRLSVLSILWLIFFSKSLNENLQFKKFLFIVVGSNKCAQLTFPCQYIQINT